MNILRREPLDWSADSQTRHGGFAMIQTAIRRGWLEGSAPELVERCARLIDDLMVPPERPSDRPDSFPPTKGGLGFID